MLQHLYHGLTPLGNGPSIGWLMIGSLVGMFFGVIPGLGGGIILSVVLAFIYHIDLTGALCFFVGTEAASYFSASVTSILLNTPAHPEAFPVTLDGFPMAQRGEAGRALGISAASTCVGGLVGCVALVGLIQVITYVPLIFHPPEYVALVTLALLLVGTLGTDQVSKAVIAAGIGLMISSIGPSIITGTLRFTFGSVGLFSGVSLVALALGSFAVPQMMMVFGTGTAIARQDMLGREVAPTSGIEFSKGSGKQIIGGILETFRHWPLLIRSGLIGVITGVVPGIGGFAANYLSYGLAQQTSRKRDQFGTGIAEGIIAPEGSSLSKEAGGFVPLLGLGIPGGVGGAIFIAALSIKGIQVGYGFTKNYPNLPYEIVWIMMLSGVIGTAAGVLSAPYLVKITKVPGPLLVPFIFCLTVFSPYVSSLSFFAVMEVLVFGFIGFVFRRLRYPLGSFVIGLVLGPTLETNIYLTHNVYHGFSFIQKRLLADGLFVLAIGVLVLKATQIYKENKQAREKLEGELADVADPELRAERRREAQLARRPYPLLNLLTTIGLLGVSVPWTIYGIKKYNFATGILPVIAGFLVILPATYRLPRHIGDYISYRRARNPSLRSGGGQNEVAGEAEDLESELELLPAAVMARATEAAERSETIAERLIGATPAAQQPAPAQTSAYVTQFRDKSWGKNGQFTREAFAFGWLVALVGLCYVVGFDWGLPIFMVVYGLVCTKHFFRTRRTRGIFIVVSAVVMWFVAYEMTNIMHLAFSPILKL